MLRKKKQTKNPKLSKSYNLLVRRSWVKGTFRYFWLKKTAHRKRLIKLSHSDYFTSFYVIQACQCSGLQQFIRALSGMEIYGRSLLPPTKYLIIWFITAEQQNIIVLLLWQMHTDEVHNSLNCAVPSRPSDYCDKDVGKLNYCFSYSVVFV